MPVDELKVFDSNNKNTIVSYSSGNLGLEVSRKFYMVFGARLQSLEIGEVCQKGLVGLRAELYRYCGIPPSVLLPTAFYLLLPSAAAPELGALVTCK